MSRDRLLQLAGLVIGFLPAFLVVWGYNTGLPLVALAVIALGFLSPKTRSFTYGALCSFLVFPGLALTLLVS